MTYKFKNTKIPQEGRWKTWAKVPFCRVRLSAKGGFPLQNHVTLPWCPAWGCWGCGHTWSVSFPAERFLPPHSHLSRKDRLSCSVPPWLGHFCQGGRERNWAHVSHIVREASRSRWVTGLLYFHKKYRKQNLMSKFNFRSHGIFAWANFFF